MARTGPRNTVDKRAAAAEARRQSEARALRNRRIITGAVVALVLIGAIVFFATRPEPEGLANIQTLPDLGQAHIDRTGPAPEYNSNPPTSGSHAPTAAVCGIYRELVPDINLVHDLEHGVVIISYDPTLPESDRQQLEDFARDAGTHIIVVPREGMETPIALTAWTKLLRLNAVDVPSIEGFYGQFAQFGPEANVPCPFSIDQSQEG
jgi:hypothetical protein